MTKKLAYVGPDGGGVRLESGLLLPHGQTVDVPADIHAGLITRPDFEDREKPTKKAEGGKG